MRESTDQYTVRSSSFRDGAPLPFGYSKLNPQSAKHKEREGHIRCQARALSLSVPSHSLTHSPTQHSLDVIPLLHSISDTPLLLVITLSHSLSLWQPLVISLTSCFVPLSFVLSLSRSLYLTHSFSHSFSLTSILSQSHTVILLPSLSHASHPSYSFSLSVTHSFSLSHTAILIPC